MKKKFLSGKIINYIFDALDNIAKQVKVRLESEAKRLLDLQHVPTQPIQHYKPYS